MFTRQQYMNRECSYSDYYGEVWREAGINIKEQTLAKVRASQDEHLNDIPLSHWDSIAEQFKPYISRALKARGDFYSMADGVSACKCAAREQAK